MSKKRIELYGVVGEFTSADAILEAVKSAVAEGYRRTEAYTPFPVEGLAEAQNFTWSPVALITLIAGILGGLTGFFMCWYANVVSFPLDIGGRPNNSWPTWIPITFEMTVLFAGLSCAIGMFMLNGLPRMNHPIFETPGFDAATRDRFFLCIEAVDPKFDMADVRAFMERSGAMRISEVRA